MRAYSVLAGVCTVLLAGCAGNGRALPILAPSAAAEVRAGDRVAIRIPLERELSDTFTVAFNGEVTVPRLGQVRAAGRPVAELQESLRTSLTRYFRNAPDVTVLRRIAVVGAVSKPDLYLVDLTVTLRDVLATAGGITEAGDARQVYIVREGQRYRVPRDAELVPAAALQSGDQVTVGRQNWLARNYPALATTAATVIYLGFTLVDRLGRDDDRATAGAQ